MDKVRGRRRPDMITSSASAVPAGAHCSTSPGGLSRTGSHTRSFALRHLSPPARRVRCLVTMPMAAFAISLICTFQHTERNVLGNACDIRRPCRCAPGRDHFQLRDHGRRSVATGWSSKSRMSLPISVRTWSTSSSKNLPHLFWRAPDCSPKAPGSYRRWRPCTVRPSGSSRIQLCCRDS